MIQNGTHVRYKNATLNNLWGIGIILSSEGKRRKYNTLVDYTYQVQFDVDEDMIPEDGILTVREKDIVVVP